MRSAAYSIDSEVHRTGTGKMLTCLFDLAQDHSDNAIGVAATIAHEMGHNFGMNHDSAGCCTTPAEDGGCIMASATG